MQHSENVTLFIYNTQDDRDSFDNETFTVRTYQDSDGSIWFCAKDVCEILDITNHRDAISTLEADEVRGSEIPTPSNGGYSKQGTLLFSYTERK